MLFANLSFFIALLVKKILDCKNERKRQRLNKIARVKLNEMSTDQSKVKRDSGDFESMMCKVDRPNHSLFFRSQKANY